MGVLDPHFNRICFCMKVRVSVVVVFLTGYQRSILLIAMNIL